MTIRINLRVITVVTLIALAITGLIVGTAAVIHSLESTVTPYATSVQ